MGILEGKLEQVDVVKEEEIVEMISDIVILILLRLPVKSLLRFKCVSKFWYSLITSDQFVKMHLLHTHTQIYNPVVLHRCFHAKNLYAFTYSGNVSSPFREKKEFDYPFKTSTSQIQIWGSCNGLLLISVTGIIANCHLLCLWNPATKEYTRLPDHEYRIDVAATAFDDMATYGFGFKCTMDEYKVIRLHAVNTVDKGFVSVVKVCTIGTHWRSIRPLPYMWPSQRLVPGLHANGAVHWLISMSSQLQTPSYKLFSIDIGDEEYRDVPKPPGIDETSDQNLCLLRGCLSILINNVQPKYSVDVWMMMDYAVKESWTKLFRIYQPNLSDFPRVRLLWFCKNGEFLMSKLHGKLYVYDPKSDKAMDLNVPLFSCVETCVQSLVSLGSRTFTFGSTLSG